MARPPTPPRAILFACVGNAGRSAMAEGFARKLSGGKLEVRSGGSRPASAVMPEAVEAMRERGIDISGHRPKPFDEAWVRERCGLVVTMGCGDDACPAFLGKRMVDWALPDPKGRPVSEVRLIRDRIETLVRDLLQSEGVLPPQG